MEKRIRFKRFKFGEGYTWAAGGEGKVIAETENQYKVRTNWFSTEWVYKSESLEINSIEDKEICICAAVQMEDGTIFRGHRHADAMRTAHEKPKYKKLKTFKGTQGFITSKNRYVARTEGAELQKAAGIKSIMPKGQEFLGGELYSEDLY